MFVRCRAQPARIWKFCACFTGYVVGQEPANDAYVPEPSSHQVKRLDSFDDESEAMVIELPTNQSIYDYAHPRSRLTPR
jgi:hypothetical protein